MTGITKANEYDWYKAALAGTPLPLSEGDIISGRFRWKRKDAPAVGVAIWRDWVTGGVIKCSYDLKTFVCAEGSTNLHRLQENMPWISKGVIPPNLYKMYYDSGCTKWPDESQAGAEQRAATQAERQDKPAPVTFQFPPDTFEGLQERLTKYRPQAESLIAKGAATADITADIAADLKNVFSGLETTADTKRLAATFDLRTQVEVINKQWYAVRDAAKLLKAQLATLVISPFHAKEVIRLQQEQADRLAKARENNVLITKEMAAAPKVSSGTMGRKVAPRSVCSAKITDPRDFLAFLAGNDEIHPGILAAMQVIADAGGSTDPAKCVSYPGVEYVQSTLSA